MSKLAELMVIRAKLASESPKLSDINELREHMGINPIDSQEDMFEDLNQREKVLFSRAVHVTGLLRKWVSLSSPQSFDRPIEELDNQTERSFERTLDLLDKQSRTSTQSNGLEVSSMKPPLSCCVSLIGNCAQYPTNNKKLEAGVRHGNGAS